MLSGPTSTKFSFPKLRLSYQGTKNVAIYAFSLGKILDVRKVAGVKNMTNIMSAVNIDVRPHLREGPGRAEGRDFFSSAAATT